MRYTPVRLQLFMKKTDHQLFVAFCLRWQQLHGRHDLPWRKTIDPYAILVSELMLQQTQVARVIPKFQQFMMVFPSLQQLSTASLVDVLVLWQGLGYNRRARYLWQLAVQLVATHQHTLPKSQSELESLPGIGPYTAAAVMAFAYNQPTLVLETNVRAVLLYHFFPKQDQVADAQLRPILEACLPLVEPRIWYAALMDYGSYLKSVLPNPSRKSKHHTFQSRFAGSVRQVRGEIIKVLTHQQGHQGQYDEIKHQVQGNQDHFELAVEQLCAERLLHRDGDRLLLGEKVTCR